MLRRALPLAATALLLTACGGAPTLTEADQQAAWGDGVYRVNCARCHDAGRSLPILTRERLAAGYADAGQLEAFISRRMPYDRPGSLPEDDYWAVTAYLLDREGLLSLPSDRPLGPANAKRQRLAQEQTG